MSARTDIPGTTGRKTAFVLSAVFVVSVFLPLVDSWLGIAPVLPNFEKREFAKKPTLLPQDLSDYPADRSRSAVLESLDRFPRDYEAWYDDHFGLRSQLIRWHNIFKARVLRTAPNDEVVIGRGEWLYYGGQLNIEQYRAVTLMPDEILDGWLLYLSMVREWVEDHGADYLLVLGPSKHTIQPEYLPERIQRIGDRTRREQFVEALVGEGRQWTLDLTDTLLEENRKMPTYQETDTHWTSWGSLVATRTIVDELIRSERYSQLQPLSVEDFEQVTREQEGGDIAELMGLTDLYRVEAEFFEPKGTVPYTWSTDGLPPGVHSYHTPYAATYEASMLPEGGLPRAVVFHDSFGEYLAGFLPFAFGRTVLYWQYLPSLEIIAQEQPDLVIQEIGERVLIRDELKGGDVPFPIDDRIRADFRRRRMFRAAAETTFRSEGSSDLSGLANTGTEHALLRVDVEVDVAGSVRSEEGDRRELVPGRNVVYLEWSGVSALSFEPASPRRIRSVEARELSQGADG